MEIGTEIEERPLPTNINTGLVETEEDQEVCRLIEEVCPLLLEREDLNRKVRETYQEA